MRLDRYELKANKNLTVFEFTSDGPKGRIPKIIYYTSTNYRNFYNLGFGDKKNRGGDFDDKIVTNNGDREKVLATVVASIYAFTAEYENAIVYATGSTNARTRLYRMGIAKYLQELENDFEIFGDLKKEWVEFENGVNFDGFAVMRKTENDEN